MERTFCNWRPTPRPRISLGGRGSMVLEPEAFLKHLKIERERRHTRQKTSAASQIQKFFRRRMDIELAQSRMRKQFHHNFGDHCQKPDRNCLSVDSAFLPQLLLFFSVRNNGDISILTELCRLLLELVHSGGDLVSIFSGEDYFLKRSIVNARVKKLTVTCLTTIYCNRNGLKNQLVMPSGMPTTILLDTVAALINPDHPWTHKVIDHLLQHKVFFLLRGIILSSMHNMKESSNHVCMSSFENLLTQITVRTGGDHYNSDTNMKFGFPLQILSIPFIWHHLPFYKKIFLEQGLAKCYIHELSLCFSRHVPILPKDKSRELPGLACILSNIVEVAIFPDQTFNIFTGMEFVLVLTYLLDAIPILKSAAGAGYSLDTELEMHIKDGMNFHLFQLLVNALFKDTSLIQQSYKDAPSDEEVKIVGSVCCFLHVTFSTLPSELIIIGLARGTDIVLILWNFIKYCDDNMIWPIFTLLTESIPNDASCKLLSLAAFCPLYKYLLSIMDNEEFYEQELPLSLTNIRLLVIILKQVLFQLLWVIPTNNSPQLLGVYNSASKKFSVDTIRTIASAVISELITQLHDWNNRRSFTSASDFHLLEISNDFFIAQALIDNSIASRLLKSTPFLVSFACRIKIFKERLTASKNEARVIYPPSLFEIRRDKILEDAFTMLSVLSNGELRGSVRVAFVNDFEVEIGVDGGGLFRNFMENCIQEAFDVQYGLFKETNDHLLYPHPGSGLIDIQQLTYFNFLGCLLGKAMYEGILVDISFATFFLRKLKQKHNDLNDMPSLDPELYRHLLFLKHYQGDITELELYFVIINNEFGEQKEEDLRPCGKDIRVTKENISDYISRVASYRLNYQIQHQSSYFLHGFHQLIDKELIDMFSEPEIQILISGTLESLDMEDLRRNATYSSGYHQDHPVIDMFWEVMKSFSLDHQKKFLKFVTGCSRGPLLGFRNLHPKFCISSVVPLNAAEVDLDRLPTAATCFNNLKLPPYKSIEQIREKLLYAITADVGFHLS